MTKTKLALGIAVAAGLLAAPATLASTAIAKKEGGLVCTRCHDKPGSKLLTDDGKYYELMGSFQGLEELEERFQQCTSCHVRKPGSDSLTKTGRRYQWMMSDMDGIKSWLLERHPGEGEEAPEQEEAELEHVRKKDR